MYIYWICDKANCGIKNTRKLEQDDEFINDDTCDKCKLAIHEPLLVEIDPFENKKKTDD